MVSVGISLGILMAVISSIAVLFGMMVMTDKRPLSASKLAQVIGLFSTVPTLWTGGHWATTVLLHSVDFSAMFPPYVQSLACTFSAIMCLPLYRLVVHVANKIRQEGSSQNG